MRVLFLTFYFSPDLSAGAFRATALVEALQSHLPDDSVIDVLTTHPNRYKSFSAAALETETVGRATIRRIELPPHQSGFLDQSRAFIAYARWVRAFTSWQDYDLVIASSSRLMTAFLGSRIARRTGAPLYLDIRDIFVDTLKDLKPGWLFRPASRFFRIIESSTIRQAAAVNLVSQGFEDYFRSHYPKARLSFFPNGIDDTFIDISHASAGPSIWAKPCSVLYAGNIGEGQGLHAILPALSERMRDRVSFTVIGDGGRKKQLEAALKEKGIRNVVLRDPLERNELVRAYQAADVLFLHLNDYDAFNRVLPSKIFEYAATGKPIWAGVAGHAARFIMQSIENAQVFPPCDDEAAAIAFAALNVQYTPRTAFVAQYSRRGIMDSLARDILAARTKAVQQA